MSCLLQSVLSTPLNCSVAVLEYLAEDVEYSLVLLEPGEDSDRRWLGVSRMIEGSDDCSRFVGCMIGPSW